MEECQSYSSLLNLINPQSAYHCFQTEALYALDIVVLLSLASSVFWIHELRKVLTHCIRCDQSKSKKQGGSYPDFELELGFQSCNASRYLTPPMKVQPKVIELDRTVRDEEEEEKEPVISSSLEMLLKKEKTEEDKEG